MQPTEKNDVFKNLFRFFRLEGAKFPQGVNILGRRRERTLKKHARKALPCMPGTCAAEGGGGTRGKNGAVRGRRKRDGAKAERLEERGADAQGTWWRMWWGKGGRAERRKGGRKGAPGRKSPCARLFHGGSRMPGPGLRERECRKSGGPDAGWKRGEDACAGGKREEHKGKRGWRATAQGGSGTRERGRGKGAEMCGAGRGDCFRGKGKNTE